MTQRLLDTEEIVTELDISHLVIEDDTPVDNFQSELQQRLLVEPIYSSKALPLPFLAAANVGLFYKLKGDPIVPDMLLSLGVQRAVDLSERRNRSYFVWEFGKVPEVCIEIVSNAEGDELILSKKSQQKGKVTCKKDIYAQIGVPYYVVFDPLRQIQGEQEMNEALLRVWTISPIGYTELTPSQGIVRTGESIWLEGVGLGLTLWEGPFEEEVNRLWLRWCDQEGQVIATGSEGQALERQRAEQERQRAEQEHQRAEQERQRAEQERQRAEQERQAKERLENYLRSQGIDPDQISSL
ncbi:MAG: Uma2 family endonuclease [Leptolyngbyaceae cyanobacterium RM1_406_9]|nr:Uma2 family endonuclease [Leptolyngbyaceae cyanobacterium RM1_406_9]